MLLNYINKNKQLQKLQQSLQFFLNKIRANCEPKNKQDSVSQPENLLTEFAKPKKKMEALLRQVFGDSSDSEDKSEEKEDSIDDVGCHSTSDPDYPTWEPIKEIKGLWLCRHFLSPHQQSTFLSAIQNGACVSIQCFHSSFLGLI